MAGEKQELTSLEKAAQKSQPPRSQGNPWVLVSPRLGSSLFSFDPASHTNYFLLILPPTPIYPHFD